MKSRRRLLKFSGIAVIAAIISGCSSAPENISVIPSHSQVVCNISLLSLAQKGKLDELSEFRTFKTLKKEIRKENRRVSGMMEDLIEDPGSTGINFTEDVLFFVLQEAQREVYFGLSLAISDAEKFEIMIEDLMDEIGADFDEEKDEKFQYVLLDNNAAIGWDQKKALLLVGEGAKARENLDYEIEDLFELDENDQISAHPAFSDFYGKRKDLSLWLSSSIGEEEREFKELENILDMDLTDIYLASHLSFEDDEIVLTASIEPNEDLAEFTDDYPVFGSSNGDLHKYLPEEAYSGTSCAINPMSIYAMLSESPDINEIEGEFKRETNIDLEDLFEALGGTAVYTLSGFERMEYTYTDWGYGFNESAAEKLDERYSISEAGYLNQEERDLLDAGGTIQCRAFSYRYCINIHNILEQGYDCQYAIDNGSLINWYDGGWDYGPYIQSTREELLPLMSLVTDINGSELIDDIIDELPEDELNKQGDYYEFLFDNRYPAYFAYSSTAAVITNDKNVARDFENGGVSPNFGSNSHSSAASSNAMYGFFNLDYSTYPKSVRNEMDEEMRGDEKVIFDMWQELAGEVEMSVSSDYSVEVTLKLKDGEGNSLYRIFALLDDNVRDLMDM